MTTTLHPKTKNDGVVAVLNPAAPYASELLDLTHYLDTMDPDTYGLSRSSRLAIAQKKAKRAHAKNVAARRTARRSGR